MCPSEVVDHIADDGVARVPHFCRARCDELIDEWCPRDGLDEVLYFARAGRRAQEMEGLLWVDSGERCSFEGRLVDAGEYRFESGGCLLREWAAQVRSAVAVSYNRNVGKTFGQGCVGRDRQQISHF